MLSEFFAALRDGLLFRRRRLSAPAYVIVGAWLVSLAPLALWLSR